MSGGLLFGDSCWSLVAFLHFTALLDTVELNMAVGGKVWTDTTVSTIGSSTSLDSPLDHDVADDTVIHVQSLGLSICLEVDEEFFDGLARLFWPTAEWNAIHFGLRGPTDTSRVLSKRNDSLVFHDSVHVLDGVLQLQTLAETRCFVTGLVMRSQVGNSALSS